MTSINSTNNLCLFCYKSISPEYHNAQNRAEVNKFCTNLTRLLNSSSKKETSSFALSSKSSFGSCGDCEILITQVSHIYHELKCLELKLFWKVERLGKVMNFADKLPSRVAHMTQHFKSDNSESARIDNTIQKDLTAFRAFRAKIKIKCK